MGKRRLRIQLLGALAFNGNLKGYINGKIYQGNAKSVCVPVLNCYSCPGAVGSCPIGSLQGVSGGFKYNISYYVLGLMTLFGIIGGRIFCGYLCPFGLYQDLLHKISTKKWKYPRITKYLQRIKYVILGAIILVPLVVGGLLDPLFCKYICPSGTLGAGVPLAILDPGIRAATGLLYVWKLSIAIVISLLAIKLWRPFCRVLCPLGAFYGLLNPLSVYSLQIQDSCISCGKCKETCHYDIYTKETPNNPECVRCDRCVSTCPVGAITKDMSLNKNS